MLKTISFFLLALCLISCGKGGDGQDKQATSVTTAEEIVESDIAPETPAPPAALAFKVKARFTDFSSTQKFKVKEAIEAIKEIIASDEFKQKVLNKTYNGKKRYVDNKGLTNSQIYKKILEASETLTPAKDGEMDLYLKTYYTASNVIGYTKPSIKTIYMNRKYLSTFEMNKIAMNLTHEWLHKIGFGHAYEATASRPHSVPYAIGYIVRDIAKKYN